MPATAASHGVPRTLPPIGRPDAALAVLDISEYFGDRSGGVRTYLHAKGRYIAARPSLRRTLVVPGASDAIHEQPGDRTYRLRGPAIPFASYRLMLATRSVARIIAHERPDVVEVGSAYLVPWLVSRARRRHPAKVAWFYHSNLPRLVVPDFERRGVGPALVARLIGDYVRRLSRLADVTLAASDFSAQELARWGVSQIERVTLGVDTEQFTPSRRVRRDAVRAQLGIEAGPLVGFVGRLASEKQVDILLRAWPAVARQSGATLLIVGDGPQAARLAALARGQRVIMRPHLTDRDALADLLAALDLYVSPAPFETFGLAVCEALASGVPVVSVDHGAAAELVRASGAGRLAPLGDVTALSEAIVDALCCARAPLAAAARRHVERHHRWDIALGQLLDVYRRLIG
ncbi:MAG: glycosyltransferase [Gemmatimonadales bacterium]|nr:glycosyltransferase [Gemmatimonadales bacterium]